MTTIRVLTVAVLLVFCTSATAQKRKYQGGAKKLYCWNENGRKVCGDALPPEAAESARTEISVKSGLQTGQVARALTVEERNAAASVSEQAQLAAQADAARQRRDLAMVESYDSEAALRHAYGERTGLLDASLKTSALGETNLRRSLVGLLSQASDLELAGKPVANNLVVNIRSQHEQLLKLLRITEQQRHERLTLDGELNDAVARYRTLKQPPSETAPATSPPTPPQG